MEYFIMNKEDGLNQALIVYRKFYEIVQLVKE